MGLNTLWLHHKEGKKLWLLNIHSGALIDKENWTMAIWNCNIFSSGKNWEICIELLNWSQSFADWFPWCPLSSSHLFDFVCCYLLFWSATLSSGYVHHMHVICPEQTMILHLSLGFLYSILPSKLLLNCFLSHVWAGDNIKIRKMFSHPWRVLYTSKFILKH